MLHHPDQRRSITERLEGLGEVAIEVHWKRYGVDG
jgi:hypothetical protein